MSSRALSSIKPDQAHLYQNEIDQLLDSAHYEIVDLPPSEWIELNRMMTSDVSAIPGLYKFDNAPYCKEIVDCADPNSPVQIVAIMKGAQIGLTAALEGMIGYTIAVNPAPIMYLVGHSDLVKKAAKRVDHMIDGCDIRHLIKTSIKKAKNMSSGDTDGFKEFGGGSLLLGTSNHKTLRQISVKLGIIDDLDAMKGSTKEAGSTQMMIEQRFASFGNNRKIYFLSSPELEETSNIKPIYLQGDQRKYHIPCPCCNEMIVIEWSIKSELDENETAGITWELDGENKLIEDSVGYICQKCGDFFDESTKSEFLRNGKWIPTAEPEDPTIRSYHLSALTAPIFMYGWVRYVRQYLKAAPVGEEIDEKKMQTFVNVVLGQTYQKKRKQIKATQLMKNIRPYDQGLIPEKLSISDGNGRIIMLTCGVDCGGLVEDGRLDYEVAAYSESGARYSITHGSIGTFINKDKHPELRQHFTYEHGCENSMWPHLDMLLNKVFPKDNGEQGLPIFMTCIDSGYLPNYVYSYSDNSNFKIVNIKGSPDKLDNVLIEKKTYKRSTVKGNLYLLESNYTKDVLSRNMGLKWRPEMHTNQPFGFMNFPRPSDGLYQKKNYFSHFEAEERVLDNGKFVWRKKQGCQNHLYDCALYADAGREIFFDQMMAYHKIKNGVWQDYVNIINKD